MTAHAGVEQALERVVGEVGDDPRRRRFESGHMVSVDALASSRATSAGVVDRSHAVVDARTRSTSSASLT